MCGRRSLCFGIFIYIYIFMYIVYSVIVYANNQLHVSITFILLFHTCRLSYARTLCASKLYLVSDILYDVREREKALNIHESECLSAKERVALV